MTFGGHRLAAGLVAGLVLFAGCSGDPRPKLSPPEPSSSAADPTPTQEPKEPWEKKTNAGAVAFAEHWFEVFSAAMADGDVAGLRSLSSDNCETCRNVSDRLETIYESGGTFKTEGWRVLKAEAVGAGASGPAIVALRVHRSAEVLREQPDAEPVRNPASQASYTARLIWAKGGWVMDRLDLLA